MNNREYQNERRIHDRVGEWHEAGHGMLACPLHEYLGVTFEEYRAWVELRATLLIREKP